METHKTPGYKSHTQTKTSATWSDLCCKTSKKYIRLTEISNINVLYSQQNLEAGRRLQNYA